MREGQKIGFAKVLRVRMTDAEKKLWYHLRAKRFGGIKYVRQKPIGPYIVDFCACSQKLVVELDGSQHCDRKDIDAKRTNYLEKEGYRVVRFSDTDVLKNVTAVLGQLKEKVDN